MQRFLPDPEFGHGSDHLAVVCTVSLHKPVENANAPAYILAPPLGVMSSSAASGNQTVRSD